MQEGPKAGKDSLEQLWQQGLVGKELIDKYTSMVDEFICHNFTNHCNEREHGGEIAIIALGGYGRHELYPFSDIDLLLLHDKKAGKKIKETAEAILYPLWDSGFEVGHSVRTIKDALSFAKEDFIFKVALLDTRLLCGSNVLFCKLVSEYQKKIVKGKREQFAKEMNSLRHERHKKYGKHSFLLEPNIKEGKGGLRDIQSMLWVAKGVFSLQNIDDIQHSGIISEKEKEDFKNSWDMLIKIRNHLHYLCQRKNDHLLFEYQEELAKLFGFVDHDNALAVEQFMRKVYSSLQNIGSTTDLFFEHVGDVLFTKNNSKPEKEVEPGIISKNGAVYFAGPKETNISVELLFRIFLHAGKLNLPVHHRSRQKISDNLDLINDNIRQEKKIAKIFLRLLGNSKQPDKVLEQMHQTGLLDAYIPEFARIDSLAQHDLYHIYTVDRHQIQTVAELKILIEETDEENRENINKSILLLSGLLHDIGKGQNSDHSVLGAEMVQKIGQRLHLSNKDMETLSFLVRHHLYLPENALRRDIEDHNFICQAADLIESTKKLEMLYFLAIADSKATGPSAWSNWKASLMQELYLKIKTCLLGRCHKTETREETKNNDTRWLQKQIYKNLQDKPIDIDIKTLKEDYLTSFSTEEISRHITLHQANKQKLAQRILIFPEEKNNCWEILIICKDQARLLTKICGTLALHNLQVLSAKIFTWPDKTVVDLLEVKPESNIGFSEQRWEILEEDLNKAVNHRLDIGLKLMEKKSSHNKNNKITSQPLEKKVTMDNNTSDDYTIVEVYCGDDSAILYRLSNAISDNEMVIHKAKIATEIDQLIDVFYITDQQGRKITSQKQQNKLTQSLKEIIV